MISKKKKEKKKRKAYLPTLFFFQPVTGNKHIFFFWPYSYRVLLSCEQIRKKRDKENELL